MIRKKFGSRLLESESDVFSQNAWDNVEWTEEDINQAKEKVKENSYTKISIEESKKYDENASEYWNEFYNTHSDKFFKDRNWLFIDFPELISNCKQAQQQVKFEREFQEKLNLNSIAECSKNQNLDVQIKGEKSVDVSLKSENLKNQEELIIWELGSGTGSTIRTILHVNTNPKTFVYCSDFSSKAIEILKRHPSYDSQRCNAFVYDCTDNEVKLPFEENSIDILIMIFCLSAIRPEKMQSTINNACKYLKPDGAFLFRDYGRYDMTQLRFKQGKCISDNFYVRGDGTQAYFFTEDEIEQLFLKTGIMRKEWIYVDRKLQTNRIKKLKMFRIYLQGKFVRI